MKKILLLAATVLMTGSVLKAQQLNGTYAIPSATYATIAAAITDINLQGISGNVVFDIAAGYTETAPVGGYSLTATGTAGSSIIFQKSGAGVNPLITAYVGTQTPGTAAQDGVLRLIGSDYVTIDGIDIVDPNTTNPATMEFGIGLFKASTSNGCQNNTIKNCNITLSYVNNAAGSGPASDGSRGIDIVNATTNAHATALTITSAAGSNSNNKLYNNKIQNCNVGIALIGFAATTPFTNADQNNDVGGTSSITSNTITNFGGATAAGNPAAGIRTLAQYALNVSFNNLVSNDGTGANHANVLRGIFINTATSANATINNNTITVSSAATTNALVGIENSSGATAASNLISINNNQIINCNYTTATTGIFNAIISGVSAASVSINGNFINNINLAGTGTSVLIETGSPTNATVNTNTITNVVRTGASGLFRIIKTTSPSSFNANNNLIDGIIWNNVTSSGSVDGIYSLSTATGFTANGNIIRNISVPTSGTANGIREFGSSGAKLFSGNQIYNFSTTAGGAGGATFNGIFCSTGNIDIFNNTVYSLNSTGTSGGTGGSVMGIQISGGTTNNIYKNKIYDLSSSSTGPVAYGIYLNGGTTNNVYNNIIGDIRTTAANAAIPLAGIYVNSGTNNLYYNTVYLNAISSGALFGSTALFASTTPNLNLRNNILVNTSTPNGAGFTSSFRRSSATLTTYSSTSNNNLFYAGTPSANNVIFYDGTTSQQTLVSFKALVTPRDAASVTENVSFVSTTGSNPNFLNINIVTPTQIESGATTVSSISDDYAGTIRNATTPDIGAWEGNYTLAADMTPPTLASSGFTTSSCNLTTRTFTANITDVSGVASGSLAPRIYYKINNNVYTSVAGTLISGTALNGVYSFVLTYVANNFDVISYYLVAQDVAGTPNLFASPSVGFSGTDVNNVTTPPTTPNSYQIVSLGGIYTVGASGTFTSLTQAAAIYNVACLTSAVTFSLIDANYSTAETFPILFTNNADASSTNSLLIIPSSANNVTITGSAVASSVFKFLNSRFITLDGLNSGGSSLMVDNTNSGSSASIWLASSGAGNNTIGIKNLLIYGGNNTSSNSYGILSTLDGAGVTAVGGADNDNITIQGNTVLRSYFGLYAIGTAAVNAGGLSNWNVLDNMFGPASTSTNNIGLTGMYFSNMVGSAVNNNTVSNVQGSFSSYEYGINFNLGVNTSTIGFNTIKSIKYTGTGGYGGIGINIDVNNAASGIVIRNNMLSDITGDAWSGFTAGAFAGIRVSASQTSGGIGIHFNSVAMNQGSSIPGYSTGNRTAAIYFGSSATAIDLRNNILYSNIQYTNAASATYAIYSAAPSTAFTNINYNDYSVGGTQGVLGYIGGANRTTLAAIQTNFGGNANSMTVAPVFTSSTDLHLVLGSNVALDNFGTPIAGITTDIDGQTRNVTTPDMGADEFTSPVCTAANGGTIAVATLSACAGQTLGMISNGVSTGINTVYQWKVATVSGGPYSNVIGGAGANTATYTTGSLAAGTFYYVLETQCTSATLTSISNEATVTVAGIPVISVSPNTATICMPGGSAVGLTASGGNNYTWTPTTGLTGTGPSVNVLPSTSIIYSVTGDNASGCTAIASATIIVSQYPSLGSVSATPSVVCTNGTSSLQAVGTLTTYGVSGITYAPIATPGTGVTVLTNNGTAVVPLTSGSLDDGGWNNQVIPFAFNFFGANYTSFAVSTNGFIFLGTGSPTTFSGYNNVFPSVTPAKPVIGAAYSDLDFDGVGSNSTIQYFVSGTTPNQKLVVNWSGQFYNNTGTVVTQAILYESTNVIEVHTFSSTAVNNAVQGIQNASGTSAFVAPGRNNTQWPVTTPDAYRWTPHSISYSWTPSTFLSSTSIANPVASNVTSATLYSVALNGSNGCSTGTTVSLSVDVPSISITAGGTVCAGTTVTLTASGTTSYSWSTGSTSASITESPTITTSYVVTGTNAATGCTATASESVTVNSLPNLAITSPSAICIGETATLTANGATSYSWNTTAITSSITDAPTSTANYSVTGTDANNCSAVALATVIVNSLPNVVITGTSTVCDGSSVNLTASGATTYSWDNGSTSANITPTPTGNVTYTVTGIDNNNCVNIATQAITVNPNPTVTVSGGFMCPGDSFTLSPSGAVTYTYLPNGPVVSPGSTTTYTISGEDALGCVTQTAATAVVTVTNSLNVTISGSTTICNGQVLNLTANGATTYSWNTGSTSQSIAPSPTTNTTYSVLGTSGSCSSTAVVNVSVNALPSLTLTAATSTACTNGPTIALSGSPAGGSYSGSNVSGSMFTPPATQGTFNAVYSYTDGATGCSNTTSASIVVSICTDLAKIGTELKGLSVYPNPNAGEFVVELNNGLEKTVEISDVTGRIILSSNSNNQMVNMNITTLTNGIYFVKVISGDKIEIIKVIKQ